MGRLVFFTQSFIRAPLSWIDRRPGSADLRVRFGLWRDNHGGAWLLDTGYADEMLRPGMPWELKLYHRALRARPTGWTPARACAALGIKKNQLRGVVLSHLHMDHCEALADPFLEGIPVWAPAQALDFARSASVLARRRQGLLMDAPLQARLEQAQPYTDTLPVAGLKPVDLPGHAPGHTGLWIQNPGRQVLWAVDTAWTTAGLAVCAGPRWPLSHVGGDSMARDRSRAFVAAERARGAPVVLCHEPARGAYDHPVDIWTAAQTVRGGTP